MALSKSKRGARDAGVLGERFELSFSSLPRADPDLSHSQLLTLLSPSHIFLGC